MGEIMRGSRMRLVGITLAASLMGSTGGVAAAELPSAGQEFDEYRPVPLLGEAPAYAGPPTVTSLDDVRLAQEVDAALTPEARQKLVEQGFVIVPSQIRLFHEAYDGLLSKRIPAFVTTDIDRDMEQLSAEGVQFLSREAAVVEGPGGRTTRFICFRDPDGTVLELVEMAPGKEN